MVSYEPMTLKLDNPAKENVLDTAMETLYKIKYKYSILYNTFYEHFLLEVRMFASIHLQFKKFKIEKVSVPSKKYL